MRYSTEPKFRNCVKIYGFLSFAGKFGYKYGKNLMDTATKTEIDAAKTASKGLVQKTTEATEDLKGNKVAKRKRRRETINLHITRKKTANY